MSKMSNYINECDKIKADFNKALKKQFAVSDINNLSISFNNDCLLVGDGTTIKIKAIPHIISLKEKTIVKEVKIPRYKAAPKIEQEEYKVVQAKFSSGNTREAICIPEDINNYSLETGISICILKEIFGGTKEYNDYIRETVKFYKEQMKKEEEFKEKEEIKARQKVKNEKRKAERKARKEAAERQEKINIQAEAYFKAMKMYEEETGKKVDAINEVPLG